MKFPTTKMAAALVLAMTATGAHAIPVTSWQLGDFNSDGLMSDFAFFVQPTGSSTNKFAPSGELCGATPCAPIATDGTLQGVNTFTMGFNLSNTGFIKPYTDVAAPLYSGVQADITNGVLTFSSLYINAQYANSGSLDLFPDDWTIASVTDLGGGDYGVVVNYRATVTNAASSFNGVQTFWRLEGVMSTAAAPVPEASTYAMLLAGLGLVGFLARRRVPLDA